MNKKPFYMSKTLWTNLIMVIAAVSGAFGLDLGLDPETQLTVVIGIMGIVNAVLRFTTKSAIGS